MLSNHNFSRNNFNMYIFVINVSSFVKYCHCQNDYCERSLDLTILSSDFAFFEKIILNSDKTRYQIRIHVPWGLVKSIPITIIKITLNFEKIQQ